MTSTKLQPSTLKYAQEFKYWKDAAHQFFDMADKRINDALESGEGDDTVVEAIADAWHKCLAAEWTLFKSGKQTANRMALRRGIDVRQYHPAQDKKKKADEAVAKMLEDK